MTFQVYRYPDARAFLARAEAWLLQAEAEHNLLLSIARQLADSAGAYEAPPYLATVEDERGLVGCAFRTPPFKLGLTRMPEAALPVLVEDVAQVFPAIPAVLGPEPVAVRFAECWSRKQGVSAAPGMRQRIYQLEQVSPLERQPPGRLRAARREDVRLAAQWIASFISDARVVTASPAALAERLVAQQTLFFWEDAEPRSMAAGLGQTPNGVRVGYVYTPPPLRGRGYASACVAALSQHLLNAGCTFCFLYTDLANPVSNGIYQKIGYRPVCDVMDYHFGAVEPEPAQAG